MNTEQPLISIIIPTYNRAHLIGETLDSVLAQTYTHWECIVVDDGSTDGTDELMAGYVAKDSRFKYFHRPDTHKPGGNGARNYGFLQSKGEYLMFLDSDDFLEPFCLNDRISCTISECNSKLVYIFYMGIYRFNKKTDIVFNSVFLDEKEYLSQFLLANSPWTITSVFWTREIFNKLNKFDEDFTRLQDIDIHTRLLLNGTGIKVVKKIDSWYRVFDDLKDYVKVEKRPMLIKNHIKFISKYFNIEGQYIMNTVEINSCLRILFIKLVYKYVFDKDTIVSYSEVIKLNRKLNILTTKEELVLSILHKYHQFGLYNKFGYYRLKKLISI